MLFIQHLVFTVYVQHKWASGVFEPFSIY